MSEQLYLDYPGLLRYDELIKKEIKDRFTDSEKNKLSGILAGALVNVQADWNATSGDAVILNKPTIPAAVAVKGNSEQNYRTGNVNITPENIGLGNVGNFKAVSTNANLGLSSTELSNARANIGAGTSSFSGSYNDLTNKPTLFSGNYSDLTNKPSIPSLDGYATQSWVNDKVDDLVGINADGVSTLAAVLADNNKTTGILTQIASKVDKESGKRLMADSEGTKLAGIESGAQVHKAPTSTEVKTALGTGSGTSKYLREDGTWLVPPDNNSWRPLGTTADTACAGNDSRLSDARPASDVYSWAKASSKPSYSWSEISGTPSSLPANGGNADTVDGYHADGLLKWSDGTADTAAMGWGTLTAANGYTICSHASSTDGGDMGFVYKNGQISMQVDGYFYQNEGQYRVLDTSDASNLSVNYANSAGSVAWENISGKPGSMPASDVYSWAKASSKPSYSWSEIGSKPSFATVATSGSYDDLSNKPNIPTNNNQLTNGAGYITGIDKSMVTTALGYTPPTSDTNTWRTVQCDSTSIGDNTLNLVAGSNVTLTRDGGKITIASSYTDTWRPLGTGANDACAGNDSRLSNSRPASDVYSWAKAASKPSYSWSEITDKPTIPTNTNQLTNGAGFISSVPSDYKKSYASVVSVSANTANVTCPSTLSDGDECTVIYANSGSTDDYSVTISTDYVTPDGAQLDLTCPKSGYCEVNYLNIGNTIYARGV